MDLKRIKETFLEHPQNVENRKKYYEACYLLYKQSNWETKKLQEVAQQSEITVKEITNSAQIYAIQYLKMSKEDYHYEIFSIHGQKNAQNPDSKYNILLENLLHTSEDNPKEIIQMIKKSGVSLEHLRAAMGNFIIGYHATEIDIVESNLRKKINIYANYVKEIKEQEREALKKQKLLEQEQQDKKQLPLARNYVKRFIESNFENKYTFSEKTISMGSQLEFDKMLKIIKVYDPDLYLQYQQKVADIKRKRYLYLLETAKMINYYIQNGILEDNHVVREFDIIDYVSITNLTFKQFINIIKGNISNQELNDIRQFFDRNKMSFINQPQAKKQILKEEKRVNCLKDSFGNLIPGTGRLITEKEKLFILDFLEQNHLPINYKWYSVALKRYLNNTLFFEGGIPILENKDYSKKLQKRLKQ